VLAVAGAGALLAGWVYSFSVTPVWAPRYLAPVLPPLIAACGIGLGQANRAATAALVAIAVAFWALTPSVDSLEHRSDTATLADQLTGVVLPGTLVVLSAPERVPVLHRYLPPGMRYLTAAGPFVDPTVVDWRDADRKLASPAPTAALRQTLRTLPAGRSVLFVRPWRLRPNAPYKRLVADRSARWTRMITADRRLATIEAVGPPRGRPGGLEATLYVAR
jgi:hypothetical protein